MMNHSQRAAEVVAQYGLTSAGETVEEGGAFRTPVVTESGEPALLYTYETELEASRAARAHHLDLAAQLFVVPQMLESGDVWLLLKGIDGRNLAEEFGADVDVSMMSKDRAKSVVEGVANTLRKLHMLEVTGYGDILEEADGGVRFLTFSGWAAKQLEAFVEVVRTRGFDDEIVSALTGSIAELRHELSAHHPRSPAWLTHGRLQLEHIWVDAATGHEVVGLTGFHHAATLPRELDIAHFLWIDGVGQDETLIRAFYNSYGAARTMDVQRRERFFKRLAAFLALSDLRGTSKRSVDELVALTAR